MWDSSRGLSIGRHVSAGIAVGLATACSTPHMAAPDDISSVSEVLPVSERSPMSGLFASEGFKLGPYRVADVDRKWDSSRGLSIGPWGKETKTTGYSFSLSGGPNTLKGRCESELKQQSVAVPGGSIRWGDTTLACTCEGNEGEASLVLAKDAPRMRVGDSEYSLKPVYGLAGGGNTSNPSGFRADSGEPVGAVDVLYPGQVWLRNGLGDRTEAGVTCLFTGLMLYRPPSND